MFDSGIIDPTKVVRRALLDSSSVASLMLTTECMITDAKSEKEHAHSHNHGGGGGGMGGMGGMYWLYIFIILHKLI